MATFRLTLLPAADGDCLVLTWGEDGHLSHMVVDGGRAGAYPHLHARLETMAAEGGSLELYVLTHIDADHIAGALSYLKAARRPIEPKEVWYNGYRQVRGATVRSMRQGDEYSRLLERTGWSQNRHFEGGVASVETVPGVIEVAGLSITMLSPTLERLAILGEEWDEWRREHDAAGEADDREGVRGSRRGERRPIPHPLVLEDLVADGPMDTEPPNGSSIAFVAEWRGIRVLLAGDAHPDVLATSLSPLAAAEGGRYRLDLLKASHHGSAKNTSRQLVELLDCRRIAISTNGNIHGHPDPESLARFVRFGPEGRKHLHFNYDTDRTGPWNDPVAGSRYGFVSHYPPGTPGIVEIDLLSPGPLDPAA